MSDELLMEIRITCREPISVDGANRKIVMIPFAGELYKTSDLLQRHTDIFQTADQPERLKIRIRVLPEPTGCALHAGQQAFSFIVAQGVG